MKKLLLSTLGVAGVLVGCYTNLNTNNKSYSALELHIVRNFEQKTGSVDYVTVRIPKSQILLMGVTEKSDIKGMVYLTSGSRLNIKNPIDQLALEYTIINMPNKPNGTWRSFDEAKIKAQSLPPSAWRTYTIYPKQLLEQGTSMPIWDTRYNKVADDQKAKSRVTVTLYIDGNGKVSQDIERTLVLSDSVW